MNGPELLQTQLGEPVTLELGGKSYPLKYTLFSVVLFKKLTGENLFVPSTWKNLDPETDPEKFQNMVWAGLHQRQPDGKTWKSPLSIAELEELINLGNVASVAVQVAAALTQHMPKRQETEQEKPQDAPQEAHQDPPTADLDPIPQP